MRILALSIPLLCLAAGCLLGWRLGDRTGEENGPLESRDPIRHAADPTGSNEAEPRSPRPAAPAFHDGAGQIEGRVVTPDGTPVEGVLVTAHRDLPHDEPWTMYGPPISEAAGPPDLDREFEALLGELERERRFRVDSLRKAVSGGDGTFVLSGLPAEYHDIRAFREGLWIHHEEDRWGARPGETVTLIAEPIMRLPILVVGPDGSPPPRAEIRIERRRVDTHPWTPQCSHVDLPAGHVTIRAVLPGQDTASEAMEIDLTGDRPPEPVVLVLVPVRGLRGTVSFPPGHSAAFHTVVALLLPEGASPSPQRLLEEGRQAHFHDSRGDSHDYVFRDLEPGRHLVGVVRRGDRVLTSRLVTVKDRTERVDMVVSAIGPEPRTTLVRVLAPDGRPDPWSQVSAASRDARGRGRTAKSPERVEPGVFRVFAAPVHPQAAGDVRHVITVRSKLFGNRETEYDPAEDEEVTIRHQEPAHLTVVLAGYADSRYEGETRLGVGRQGAWLGRPGWHEPALEPEGRQDFGPLTPGDWQINVFVGYGGSPLFRRPVTLASGRRTITLALAPLHTLEVLVEGKDGEKGFYLCPYGKSGPGTSPPRFEGGRVRFEHLLAGEYVLSRHHGTREHMPLTITGDRVVRFRPIVLDAILVELANETGALAGAGLRNGDLILAIDGTEITGETQGRALLTLAQRRGRGVLRIRRAGKIVDIDVALEDVTDRQQAGGELRPWTR